MSNGNKVAVVGHVGHVGGKALAEALGKFAASVEEAEQAIKDHLAGVPKLVDFEDFGYPFFGRQHYIRRDRPSKLLRRIKTTC